MPAASPVLNGIEVHNLTRSFKSRRQAPVIALSSVNLVVPRAETHGLLGPNGAGKTTLCKILSTVLLPSSGRALVAGHDVVQETAKVRRSLGVVFGGERGLYTRLTARQNLEFWGALYGLRGRALRARAADLLDRLGLAAYADDRVEGFSRGMKQRLHLARGLVGDPQVVLLDEPTTGMDPVAAREFRLLLAELREESRTVLLTTHDMAEAEATCDRVTVIDGGGIIATEKPTTLSRWIATYARVDADDVPTDLAQQLVVEFGELSGVTGVRQVGPGKLRIETAAQDVAPQVVRRLLDVGVNNVATSLPDLEEVYLHVIGNRGLRVDR